MENIVAVLVKFGIQKLLYTTGLSPILILRVLTVQQLLLAARPVVCLRRDKLKPGYPLMLQ